LIDAVTLYSGEEIKYRKLPETIIIFITEFDPFGKGRYKYTFKNKCEEDTDLELGDGCTKIFLNTLGEKRDAEKELQELIDFLKFVHESSEENANSNDKLWRLYEIVKEFKGSSQKESEYMNMETYKMEGRLEGKIEGIVMMCKEFDQTFDDTINKVAENFHLTFQEAKKKVEEYW